ncbi:hypothetical protein BMT55_13925 [Listeria newyorkensis]|uniref:Uncharacterized protein n=1 Tax=Listeria newyorkensis TaxID=1497681 RepID=A0ABX4XK15_9LIST|nr:hypothetical protein [Listeria newyorkensis]KGL45728.1 hypothetical protein EP58_03295 [Listeria newyorkensis]PNP88965.1 hypothetical protein BMT55_13925 [Listeria newyorkensis]SQC55335.1 Uncharacterised protein [Listeria newyorkensis]
MTNAIKESAYAAKAVKTLTGEYQQKEIALDNHITQALVSQQANGKRKVSKQVAKSYMDNYNNAEVSFRLLREFSGGLLPCILEKVDKHQMSLLHHFSREATEAVESVKQSLDTFASPTAKISTEQRQTVVNVMREMLDASAIINTTLAIMSEGYNIDLKSQVLEREKFWEKSGWI